MPRGGKRDGAGRPPLNPRGRREHITIRLDPDYAASIHEEAEKTGQTETAIIEAAIRDYLGPLKEVES